MTHEPFAALFPHTNMNQASHTQDTTISEQHYQPDASSPNFNETPQEQFVRSFRYLAAEIHETARNKGWWDANRNNGELLALIHSEVSEVLEALRHGNPPDDKIPEFSGAEAECADIIIRIADMAQARGWRVAEAVIAKMEMNKGRAHKHGGKQF